MQYEEAGDLQRAVQLMQVFVDYEQEIGRPDAETAAARVAELGKPAQKTPKGYWPRR